MDREAVLKILEERLLAARQREKEASRSFNKIVSDVPSGVPYPDSVSQVERAARSYRSAMQEVRAAQEQMTRFALQGVVPEDLDLGRLN